MGEVYKGLTIQIGADTTRLTAALKDVDKTARNTQSALKRIGRDLDSDPENFSLINEKLSQTAQRAAAVAVKMRLMREQMAQMRGTEIENVAKNTENLELRAASARKEYASLDRQISEIRTNAARSWGWSESAINDKNRKKEIDAQIHALAKQDAAYAKMGATLKLLQFRLKSVEAEMDLTKKAQSYKRLQEDFKLAASEAKVLARETADIREQMLALGKNQSLRQLNYKLKQADAVAEQVQAEFKSMDEALKFDPKSIDACVKRLANLKEQSNLTEERIEQLTAKLGELKAAGGVSSSKGMAELSQDAQKARARVELLAEKLQNVNANMDLASSSANEFRKKLQFADADKAEAQVRKLASEAQRLKTELSEAEKAFDSAYLTREIRQVETEIMRANAQLKNFKALSKSASGSMASAFFAMRTAGYSMSATVGGALTQVAYGVVNSAETIDSAFRDMKKTVNGTDEQFAKLRHDAIEYSKTHVTSADTILEIEAMAGQLGIAASNLEEFSTTVSNLDIATDMDAEDIAIDLGKLSNVIGDLDESNVSNFADALVRLGNNNAAIESDIMNITTRFGGMASQVGLSADEILAWATAASATGVKAESAGSNMLKTLGLINGAVSTGGKKLDAYSKVIGMSADEIKKKWGDKNGGTNEVFKSFITTLSEMKSTDIDSTLVGLGITSVRQRQLIEGLTQSIGNMDDTLQMSKDAWNGVSDEWGNAGDAAYEAQQKSEGFSGAIGMLRNNLAAMADMVGQDLVPYIGAATGALQDFEEWYSKLSAEDKDFFFKVAAGLAALGPFLIVLSAVGNTARTAVNGVEWLANKVQVANARMLVWEQSNDKVSKAAAKAEAAASESASGIASAGAAAASAEKSVAKTGKAVTTASTGYKVAAKAAESAAESTAAIAPASASASAGMAKSSSSASKAAGSFKAMGKATLASISYGSLLSLGFMAIAAGAVYCIKSIADAKAEYDNFNKAVSSTSTEDVLKSWGAIPEKTTAAAKSIRQLKDSTNQLADSMNSHTESAKETFASTAADVKQLEEYGRTVDKVSRKARKNKITKVSDLSDKDLGKLTTALNAINDATGKSYKPIDIIAKGQAKEAANVNRELQKTLQLKQLSMQQDALSSAYNDSYKDQLKAQEAYADAQQTLAEKQQKLDEAMQGGNVFAQTSAQKEYNDAATQLNKIKTELDAATLSTDKYKEAMNYLGTAQSKGVNSIQALVSSSTSAFGTLAASGQLDSFTSSLKSVGVTYKGLTADQKANTDWLAQLAASYDGTTQSIIAGLDQLGVKYSDTSALLTVTKDSIKSALAELGTDATSKLQESYGSVSTFAKQVEDAGYKISDLSGITPIQWETILNASDLGSKAKGLSDEVKKALDDAVKTNAKAKIDADTSQVDAKTSKAKAQLKEVNDTKATPKIDADDSQLNETARNAKKTLEDLNNRKAVMKIITEYQTKHTTSGGGGGGGQGGSSEESMPQPSRPVVFSTMALDASRAVAKLDAAYTASAPAVADAFSGVQAMAGRDRRRYKYATAKPDQTLDKESLATLKAIAKNTKGGKGIYLDGSKLVGGTADRYDTTMARRERLAKRGLDI